MNFKICSTCETKKPITEFYQINRPKGYKDGLDYSCKTCRSNERKTHRATRKAAIPILPESGKRKCSRCRRMKPLDKFNKSWDNKEHLSAWCIKCRGKNSTRYTLQKNHNISLEQYYQIYEKQNKGCILCQKPKNDRKNMDLPLEVDHCHNPLCQNKFRGLCCHNCNVAMGWIEYLKRNNLFDKALSYLNSHNCISPPTTV